LNAKQAVMLVEFDKLKRVSALIDNFCASFVLNDAASLQDFQEHQQEIHAKLIAIMGDRLTAHIKSMQVSLG
jgi:vacuolar protein sorting-associated protein 54